MNIVGYILLKTRASRTITCCMRASPFILIILFLIMCALPTPFWNTGLIYVYNITKETICENVRLVVYFLI